MKELIDRWEKTADRYELNASRSTNQYTSERLLASADTFKLCADELRRASQQPDPPETEDPCNCPARESCLEYDGAGVCALIR